MIIKNMKLFDNNQFRKTMFLKNNINKSYYINVMSTRHIYYILYLPSIFVQIHGTEDPDFPLYTTSYCSRQI